MAPDGFDPRLSKYFTDPIISQYSKYFGFSTADAGLLWIVDETMVAPLPLAWEEGVSAKRNNRPYYWKPPSMKSTWVHPVDAFYLSFTRRLREQLAGLNSSEPVYYFTQRPPNVCIDVLNMCAFLDIDPTSPHVWVALVALCTPLPPTWYQRDDYTYVNVETKEESASHPCDLLFYTWVREAGNYPEPAGEWIFPKLSAQESARIPEGKILAYSFKQCRACILDETVVLTVRRITPPASFGEHQPSWIQGAIANASNAVFGADVYSTQSAPSKGLYVDAPADVKRQRLADSLVVSALLNSAGFEARDPQTGRVGLIDNALVDELFMNGVRDATAQVSSGTLPPPLPRPRATLADRQTLTQLQKAKQIEAESVVDIFERLQHEIPNDFPSLVAYAGARLSNKAFVSEVLVRAREEQRQRDEILGLQQLDLHLSKPLQSSTPSTPSTTSSQTKGPMVASTGANDTRYKVIETGEFLSTSYYAYQRADQKSKVEKTIRSNKISNQCAIVAGGNTGHQALVDPSGGNATMQLQTMAAERALENATTDLYLSSPRETARPVAGNPDSTPNRSLRMAKVLGSTPVYDMSHEGTTARIRSRERSVSGGSRVRLSGKIGKSPPATPLIGGSSVSRSRASRSPGRDASVPRSSSRTPLGDSRTRTPRVGDLSGSKLYLSGRRTSPTQLARSKGGPTRSKSVGESTLHPAVSPTRGITPTPHSQRVADDVERQRLLQHRNTTLLPGLTEYTSTDFALSLLVTPPPTISLFYAVLQVDSEMARKTLVHRYMDNANWDPINKILIRELPKDVTDRRFICLRLKVKIEYDLEATTGNIYNERATSENFKGTAPWCVPDIHYYVNGNVIDGSPTSACFGYVLNTADFYVGMPIVVAENYKFIVSEIDGITRAWLTETMAFLHGTCERIDSEIGKCYGRRSANLYTPKYTVADVRDCRIPLRTLCEGVLSLFTHLQKLKPSIRLGAFADARKRGIP
ncbi:hypothetical protein GMRT_12524 [Giardia muris]|uniref:WW domain-containing protein n=1 Tax=Giardia muris TaxID=5742 RepID=A0A4Z1SR81_GIAMU|nr:hypothetical protein GMRT_12524 [Giardia muris]|eukprot:TNJ28392.1 hypothetical protein GMRT_12524 [Giardia muris]